MSSRWGWSLIPKGGIVPGLLLNNLLYSGLTTHEYAGFSGFAFIFKHAIAGYLRLPQPTPAPALMPELH